MQEQVSVTKRNIRKKKETAEMTFVEHLDALRAHLIKAIWAVLLFSLLAFTQKSFIFQKIILAPKTPQFVTNRFLCHISDKIKFINVCLNQNNVDIVNIELAGQFRAHIIVALILGLIAAFPYIVFQMWQFLKPALKNREYTFTKRTLFWIILLFWTGLAFGYFIISPLAINFLSNYSISPEVNNTINFASYFNTLLTVSLSSGIVFEIPIISYLLAKIGIVTPTLMKQYRKHAVVVAFVLSAIITPPDVFSQILVGIPIIFLYEMSIGIVKRVYKNKTVTL